MVEEELAGILSFTPGSAPFVRKFAWSATQKALNEGYHLVLRYARPDPDKFEMLSEIDRDLMRLLWTRLPQPQDGQVRVYFVILSNPLDDTAGDALVKELNPLNLRPIDDAAPGARKPMTEVGAFRLLRYMWNCPEVTEGVIAAFTWELSWPHLDSRQCSFEDMLTDLSHWFDHRPGWRDKTYSLRK